MIRSELHVAAERSLDAAALRGERLIAAARIIFCTAILIRSVTIWHARGWETEWQRALITLPALALALGFSLYELKRREMTPRQVDRLLMASVSFDALIAFVALLPNPLWPWPGYLGLVNMPDMTALVVITFATGFRMSPRAALVGSVLNALSYAVLVWVDQAVSGRGVPVEAHHYVLYGIFVAAAGGLAVALAGRTRHVVQAASEAAVRAEQARANLKEVLIDHHDLRSLVTAISMESELLAKALDDQAEAGRVRALAESLRVDVASCEASLQRIRGRALGDLLALEKPSAVAVGPIVDEVVAVVGRQFPGVKIVPCGETGAVVDVAGGAQSLRRLVFNLVVNACEGDGRRRAERVSIEAMAGEAGTVVLRIRDDGPGFAPAHLEEAGAGGSSKSIGSGLGLSVAAAVVRASGGRILLANGASGGAEVTVAMPAAEASPQETAAK